MKEQDFFRHVAGRLGRFEPLQAAPSRTVIGAPEFWQEYELDVRDRAEKFRNELEKLGGHVTVYPTLEELQQGLAGLLQELSPTEVGTWGESFLEEFGLSTVLESYSAVKWDPQNGSDLSGSDLSSSALRGSDLTERMAAVDVGITGCDYAVADTGSLVLLASVEQGRSVSLLPSIHIVLVKQSQIKTRIGEVLADIAQHYPNQGDATKQPSSINFITGPSRSSDIENDLSIGVHGPAAVFSLVLLDEENHA